MPSPKVIHDSKSPPGEALRTAAGSLFNLFPNWEFRLFGELDSTNSEARRLTFLIGGDAWRRVIMTDFQSKGRGRQGKSWIAPPESSLMATIMAPRMTFTFQQSLLPLAFSCWVVEGLERLGLQDIGIKWPNDVLIKGQKVAGLLCETSAAAVLLGVGLNLSQRRDELPERASTEPQATSVSLEMAGDYPGSVAAILTIMSALLENTESPPSSDWILRRYRDRCVSFGSSIAFKHATRGMLIGTAEDLDPSGAMIVNVEGLGRTLVSSAIE